ncbi:isoprenylcysteine carboxylmethyltransferase family protein [Streptomyces sp. MST-110588]|uniref:methyltransferase family protein n=1 Tax=Streptomyces sp. MST-110588 TaxID=2833628 RepID=UPI001F5DDCFC|nr:isoprenylcysteine carboxylmethyltransferase family protein [Streptomyces sp. MST-110588]UNO43021.1 isoprenylcysteine carboxylmethyltransferase family protein [Streptomyces sp. MST-110588]
MSSWTAWTALAVYLAGGATGFGLRSWLHYRTSGGDSGHRFARTANGMPTGTAAGTSAWWALTPAAVGIVLGGVSPVLAGTGLLPPLAALDGPLIAETGLVAALAGFGGVFVAQQAMGGSWRLGVDPGERTELVTGGIFGLVRNPIYTALLLAMAGITAMVPNWTQLLALSCLFVGVEVQVRAIEEPYLARAHGAAYARYTAGVGRFLPGVGRRPVGAPVCEPSPAPDDAGRG